MGLLKIIRRRSFTKKREHLAVNSEEATKSQDTPIVTWHSPPPHSAANVNAIAAEQLAAALSRAVK